MDFLVKQRVDDANANQIKLVELVVERKNEPARFHCQCIGIENGSSCFFLSITAAQCPATAFGIGKVAQKCRNLRFRRYAANHEFCLIDVIHTGLCLRVGRQTLV